MSSTSFGQIVYFVSGTQDIYLSRRNASGWGAWTKVSLTYGWQIWSATFLTGFAHHGDNATTGGGIFKQGNLVYLTVTATRTTAVTGSATYLNMFKLPTGFIPDNTLDFVCHGTGKCTWLCSVNSNGYVQFSRYRDENGYASCAAGNWLPINICYPVP